MSEQRRRAQGCEGCSYRHAERADSELVKHAWLRRRGRTCGPVSSSRPQPDSSIGRTLRARHAMAAACVAHRRPRCTLPRHGASPHARLQQWRVVGGAFKQHAPGKRRTKQGGARAHQLVRGGGALERGAEACHHQRQHLCRSHVGQLRQRVHRGAAQACAQRVQHAPGSNFTHGRVSTVVGRLAMRKAPERASNMRPQGGRAAAGRAG